MDSLREKRLVPSEVEGSRRVDSCFVKEIKRFLLQALGSIHEVIYVLTAVAIAIDQVLGWTRRGSRNRVSTRILRLVTRNLRRNPVSGIGVRLGVFFPLSLAEHNRQSRCRVADRFYPSPPLLLHWPGNHWILSQTLRNCNCAVTVEVAGV